MKQLLTILTIFLCINSSVVFASCGQNLSNDDLDPVPEMEEGFHASTSVEILINKSPNDISLWFDNVPPEKIIRGTKDVSGIESTKLIDKTWGSLDSRRLVCYKDHTTSIERVLKNQPGDVFKYQLWDFTSDNTHAIKYAIAEFKVKPISAHKSILEWNFSFRPNSFLFRLPLKLYARNSFQEYMEMNLKNIKKFIES